MSLIRHKSLTAYQAQFHRRYGHLRDAHVRALAWILTAPNVFDAAAPRWHGAIATLDEARCDDWLAALDTEPSALRALVDTKPTARLGRYAEKLLEFYLRQQHRLYAANIQIRAAANATIGEFDFLLYGHVGREGADGASDGRVHRDRDALIHWEFATKFYLLESTQGSPRVDSFVGPNLADTLGAKMSKIMDRQLQLSLHPAAQAYLPLPVSNAQALVKGWLFYREAGVVLPAAMGVAADHCRGFWCTASELAADPLYNDARYSVLPRLSWLAPTQLPVQMTLSPDDLQDALARSFDADPAPVLIVVMGVADETGMAEEISRGFIVPDRWRAMAAQRITVNID
jgi:hypothetical protein